jgi:ribose-phosphate pyrophosphokinase
MMMAAGVKIFAGRASKELAVRIAKSYGATLGDIQYATFSDGEFQVSFEETVRGQDVFIVQSTMPPSDNLFELLLMVDAAKRASARKIIVVVPYFGLARQDRKDKPRVAIGAKLVANMMMAAGVKIFAGRASKELAVRIAKSYGATLGDIQYATFSDGEFQVSFEETVRGQDVFIVQSTMPPTENLFELLLLIDAAKRASARKIIAVIPYFGFARQDRKDKPRVAIGAKLSANMLMAAGIDRIMTMDLHADQIQGFFEVPVDHLYASTLFLKEIEKIDSNNLVIAAPDVGGAKRANSYSKKLNCGLALCHKNRKKANEIAEMTVIGEVSGKDVVIIDDMCDTAALVNVPAVSHMSSIMTTSFPETSPITVISAISFAFFLFL